MGKTCISCSMAMEKPEDFPGGDTSKDYCAYCARPDGSLKSFEEALSDSVKFALEGENYKMCGFTTKPTEAEARAGMAAYMKTLPAWKEAK